MPERRYLQLRCFGVLVQDIGVWRISPDHFVERHGLVIIIAFGESIFAIGVGAAGIPVSASVITAALLGMGVVATLWWLYFDWCPWRSRGVGELTGPERAALAQDAYSYLHLPMIAGIVLFALGLKTTLHEVEQPLEGIAALGLCGGLALYLLAHIALRLRMGGGLGRGPPHRRDSAFGADPGSAAGICARRSSLRDGG